MSEFLISSFLFWGTLAVINFIVTTAAVTRVLNKRGQIK